MTCTRFLICGAGALVVWSTVGLSAARGQSAYDSILMGTVFDSSRGVVSAAAITVSGSSLVGGSRVRATESDGTYRFTALPPGFYDITADLKGFRIVKRIGIRLPPGATIIVDFELVPASVTEVVTVEGRSPTVDVKSAASPIDIEPEMLHHLPTSRTLPAIINLAPGISAGVSYGGSQYSNELYVEGMRTTGPSYQEPGARFHYNWVKEVQIVALGANAEHGGFTGVGANSRLRSGSNRFSGLGEYWTIRPSWVGRNTERLSERLQRRFAPRQVLAWWDGGAQVGGPIARDRVWFFSGLQYSRHDDTPAGFVGPGSRDERGLQGLVKISAALSPNLRLETFSGSGVSRVDGQGIGPGHPIETSNSDKGPQTNWNARLTWTLGPRTLVEMRHGGYVAPYSSEPRPPNTRSGPSPHRDVSTGGVSVTTDYYDKTESTVHTTSVTVTRYVAHRFGRGHDLKVGAEYEGTESRYEGGYPGGRRYYDLDGVPIGVDFWGGEAFTTGTGRTTLFAQDTWTVRDRLTASLGIRFERNRGHVPMKGNVFATNPVSPRLGVAWDVTRDHKTVVRAHWGRYHDTIFAGKIGEADRSQRSTYIENQIINGRIVEVNRSEAADNFAIDGNLRHSYANQWVIGIERELFTDFSLQARYIRRGFERFMGLIDTGSIYEAVLRPDPGPDGRLGTADDGGLLTVFNLTNPGQSFLLYTNPDQAFNRYNGVQVIGRKRYSRDWQAQASYTWSRSEGTVGNRFNVNAGRFDLGRNAGNFLNPNSFINAFGRGTFDPTHEVKLLGTYRMPRWGGFNLSGIYRYTTGQAWGRRARIVGLQQDSERVRVEPQGTRRAPAINQLDLRVEKTLSMQRTGRTLGVFFDAFNLTNQAVPDSGAPSLRALSAMNEFSGPQFGEPVAWVDPRTLRVGIRFMF